MRQEPSGSSPLNDPVLDPINGRIAEFGTRLWRNWQTRKPQELVGAIPWRFKSSQPHWSGKVDCHYRLVLTCR